MRSIKRREDRSATAGGIRRSKDLRPTTAVRPEKRLQQTIIYDKCERSSAALVALFMFRYTSRMQNVIAFRKATAAYNMHGSSLHLGIGRCMHLAATLACINCLVSSSPSCCDRSVGAAVVVGWRGVGDHLHHGSLLVGLALACLDDLLGVLVEHGVQDQLTQREQHAQPVGGLHACEIIALTIHHQSAVHT